MNSGDWLKWFAARTKHTTEKPGLVGAKETSGGGVGKNGVSRSNGIGRGLASKTRDRHQHSGPKIAPQPSRTNGPSGKALTAPTARRASTPDYEAMIGTRPVPGLVGRATPAGDANQSLQPTAAAMLVWRSFLALSAAGAAELGCSAARFFYLEGVP